MGSHEIAEVLVRERRLFVHGVEVGTRHPVMTARVASGRVMVLS